MVGGLFCLRGFFLREYNFFKVGLSEQEYTIVRLKKRAEQDRIHPLL